MSKPDFEKWVGIASAGTPNLAVVQTSELLDALNQAYAAGLERAAEIADKESTSQWGNFTVAGVEPTTATNNLIGVNAPLFYGRAQGCEIASAAIRAEKEKV